MLIFCIKTANFKIIFSIAKINSLFFPYISGIKGKLIINTQ